jgi:hypothetical protein
MGSISLKASSTLEMVGMHDVLGFSTLPLKKTRYHLNKLSTKYYPKIAKELFNLRHSSLRVTVGRAFAAFDNRFKILVQNPFHPYATQIKLVLACCILHNWILGWVLDELVPDEEEFLIDGIDVGQGVEQSDNNVWKNKGMEWAEAMWEARGSTRF